MEYWDAYDSNFNLIPGKTLIRGMSVPDGCYHLVCDILVKHVDGTYLLMQRDLRKRHGGMWEASAGGSALMGESPLECAIRELREETGISCDNMVNIGKSVSHINRAFYFDFLCVTDCPKDSIVLQEGETIAYRWISREDLLSLSKSELVTKRVQHFIFELCRD